MLEVMKANRPEVGLFDLSPFTLMREFTRELDRYPAMEMRTENGNYVFTAELPGLEKNDVRVEVTGDELVISGEKKAESKEEKEGFYRSERRYGSFYRAVPLPEGVTAADVKAKLADGVLKVTVPMPKKLEPKAIAVDVK